MIEEAIIIGLGAWRLSHLLVYEEGPFDLILNLRNKIIKPGIIEGFFPKLFSCIWCMSVWMSIFVAGLLLLFSTAAIILAAMAVAMLVSGIRIQTGE